MRPTYFADCSSEIDVGSVARIQKFPSSSFGMNSPPRGERGRWRTTTGRSATTSAPRVCRIARCEEPVQIDASDAAHR